MGHARWAVLASHWGFRLVLLAFLSIAGCSGQSEIITPPPPPPAAFTIEFKADDDDFATAQALGWANGIPEVDLTLTPADAGQGAPRTYRGSSQGTLTLTDLPAGHYTALGTRWLTDGERALLPAADDALGFVIKASIDAASAGGVTLRLPADRKRSLVISEWAFNHLSGTYQYAGFIELFNNADTTVYLDGLVVGEGWWSSLDSPPNFPCSSREQYRNDPEGIWTRQFQRFPGSGRAFAVLPGAAVTVATDAIDHRPFVARGLDLRGAEFEFRGAVDVDNPAVPDMIDIGTLGDPFHGVSFASAWTIAVPFLALPVDVPSLVKARPSGTQEWARIPAERILDVLGIGKLSSTGLAECLPLVAYRFDRQPSRARLPDEVAEGEFSLSRRVITSSAPGRLRLQHSRSGDADFIRTTRSPGVVVP